MYLYSWTAGAWKHCREKEDSRFAHVNFQVPVFEFQGWKPWISKNCYYLAGSIRLRTWVNWISELRAISTAFLLTRIPPPPQRWLGAANDSAHVSPKPENKHTFHISPKFAGLMMMMMMMMMMNDDEWWCHCDVLGKLLIPHWHVTTWIVGSQAIEAASHGGPLWLHQGTGRGGGVTLGGVTCVNKSCQPTQREFKLKDCIFQGIYL